MRRLFMKMVRKEIRGFIKFLRSSRKEESFGGGKSSSVGCCILE
jgi:hypothetical protein